MDTESARATVRYLPVSPYKIRQVLDLVRGLPVDDAIRVLQLCQKDAADNVLKLLDSAVANAEHNRSSRPTSCTSRASGATKARPASRVRRVPAVATSVSASARRT